MLARRRIRRLLLSLPERTPYKLRLLADHIDLTDTSGDDEVQRDLRDMADAIERMELGG